MENSSVSRENMYLRSVCHRLFIGLCRLASAGCHRDIAVNTIFRQRKMASNPIKPLSPNRFPER